MTIDLIRYGIGDGIYSIGELVTKPKSHVIRRTSDKNASKTPNLSTLPSSSAAKPPPPPLHLSSNHRLRQVGGWDTPLRREPCRSHTIPRDVEARFPRRLNLVIQKLTRIGSTPLKVLQDEGDWDEELFWAVINFLKRNTTFEGITQLFNAWKTLEKSRINGFNYTKIISLLTDAGHMDEAVSLLQDMKALGLEFSSDTYNSIIHGYAFQGKFDEALVYLKEMEEIGPSRPDTITYDGLIEAYGKFSMYDEMIGCVKMIESNGCCRPDHVTYNLLIRELARGGLLNRMERMCQSVISKKMHLQSSTLVAIIEAYAKFGMIEKMEKAYRQLINSRTALKEDMMRNVARVYTENYMFSRLSELGNDLGSRIGTRTDLVWCLRLLSHASGLSKKGMETVLLEMEELGIPWNVTVANVLLLAYFKMKNYKRFRNVFSELTRRGVEPDLVTFGVLFDAKMDGFDLSRTIQVWKRSGYLDRAVEMNTDPLVLTAFGKGIFLRTVEDMYSLDPQSRKQKQWTYRSLISFVVKWKEKVQQLSEEGKLN